MKKQLNPLPSEQVLGSVMAPADAVVRFGALFAEMVADRRLDEVIEVLDREYAGQIVREAWWPDYIKDGEPKAEDANGIADKFFDALAEAMGEMMIFLQRWEGWKTDPDMKPFIEAISAAVHRGGERR